MSTKRNPLEIVLILHEPEVAVLWSLLQEHFRTEKYDLTSDVEWNELLFKKTLETKLRKYLDDSSGPDVISAGDILEREEGPRDHDPGWDDGALPVKPPQSEAEFRADFKNYSGGYDPDQAYDMMKSYIDGGAYHTSLSQEEVRRRFAAWLSELRL